MRYIAVLLLLFFSINARAQKHHVFADVGYTPGFSVTYNYTPIEDLGIGLGVQGYNYRPTLINSHRFVPALFADVRLNIRPKKNNQFMAFWDIGMDFYKQDQNYYSADPRIVYNVPKSNGLYSGGGFGYMRRITKRGGGPYASLKVIMNITKVEGYNTAYQEMQIKRINGDGTFALSIGFKF